MEQLRKLAQLAEQSHWRLLATRGWANWTKRDY